MPSEDFFCAPVDLIPLTVLFFPLVLLHPSQPEDLIFLPSPLQSPLPGYNHVLPNGTDAAAPESVPQSSMPEFVFLHTLPHNAHKKFHTLFSHDILTDKGTAPPDFDTQTPQFPSHRRQ